MCTRISASVSFKKIACVVLVFGLVIKEAGFLTRESLIRVFRLVVEYLKGYLYKKCSLHGVLVFHFQLRQQPVL